MLSPEIIREFVNGFDDEDDFVDAIKTYLRDDADKALLIRLDLSIEDVLNGRCNITEEINGMFEKWNAKIGQHVFGFA